MIPILFGLKYEYVVQKINTKFTAREARYMAWDRSNGGVIVCKEDTVEMMEMMKGSKKRMRSQPMICIKVA